MVKFFATLSERDGKATDEVSGLQKTIGGLGWKKRIRLR